MSTSTARLSPAGTSKGNALRFSPTIGSTSGTSASGHTPAAPSPPVCCDTLMSASRYSVTSRPLMLWPLPSPSPSRLIDTPVAGPVTTTWKDSNSFRAAAITAVAAAPCGTCACGRTFTAAGAVQTWAASEALPARKATAAAASWESFIGASPWLAASRNGGCFPFRSANEVDVPPLPSSVSGSRGSSARISGGRGQTSPLGPRPRTRTPAGPTCGGSPAGNALREDRRSTGCAGAGAPLHGQGGRRLAARWPDHRKRSTEALLYRRSAFPPGQSTCGGALLLDAARNRRLRDRQGGRLLARRGVLMFGRWAGPPSRPLEGRVASERLGTCEPLAAGARLAGAAHRPGRLRRDGALPRAALPRARTVVPRHRAVAARAGAL